MEHSKIKALQRQVGGNHYKVYAIEPVVYITTNKLSYNMGNIVKYASRVDTRKEDELDQLRLKIKDLQKISHYAEIAEELAIQMYAERFDNPPELTEMLAEIKDDGTTNSPRSGNDLEQMDCP